MATLDPEDFVPIGPPDPGDRIRDLGREPALTRILPRREAPPLGIIPLGWGIAWREWNKDAYTIMPIPLNLVASWIRALWYAGIHGYTLDSLTVAEDTGYQLGLKHGKEKAIRAVERRAEELRVEGEQRFVKRMIAALDAKDAAARENR